MGKKIVFDSFDTYDTVKTLADHSGSRLNDEGIDIRADISSKQGQGHISGLDFKDGISMLIFDCVLKEELVLIFRSAADQPLRLLFGVEGELTHSVEKEGLRYQLQPLRCAMVCTRPGNEQHLVLPAAKPLAFYCIDIDRKKYRPKIAKALSLMPAELAKVFDDAKGRVPFFYAGSYNLAVSEAIQNIRMSRFNGAVRRVYLESQTLEIMSMLIKQFIDDLSPMTKQRLLPKRDMELIMEARRRLLLNLVNPPTIRELAQMMGTNENKLKAGFKVLYGTSINKVLQDERLSRAKLLMAEESFPIKEVAKLVGYKHSAHFASKFKKRFGILPNAYIKSIYK